MGSRREEEELEKSMTDTVIIDTDILIDADRGCSKSEIVFAR